MVKPLSHNDVHLPCDPSQFGFVTTNELAPLKTFVGQERAMQAIDFGVNMQSHGFNIYVLGENGTGKVSAVRQFVSEKARSESVPNDWVYVNNFLTPEEPVAISLPPGQGVEFQRDMMELISYLRTKIPTVFESKAYDTQRDGIVEKFQKKRKDLFDKFDAQAETWGFKVQRTVNGYSIVAMNDSGEMVNEEEYAQLTDEKKNEIRERGKFIQGELDDIVRELKDEDKKTKKSLTDLERSAAISVLGHGLEEVKRKYKENEKLLAYLDAVQENVLTTLDDFKGVADDEPPQQNQLMPMFRMPKPEPDFLRYNVNVIVNNARATGAPCVYENNPTYFNLFGRVEHKFQMGASITDFTMIKGGALHKANGGFLVMSALDLLRNFISYEALKRAVRERELKIEDMMERYRLVSTAMLKPEPIPLNVKVILIGSPEIYYILYNMDEDYRDLFKVKADFDYRIARTEESLDCYARFIASKTASEKLLPFHREGVAKVVDFGARLAEDQGKLSTKFSDIANLLREANYWAVQEKSEVVDCSHVRKALRAKIHRNSMLEDRLRELTAEGTLIVDTSGTLVGQANGLAVYNGGDHSFGKASRITASVHVGRGGVIHIERQTKMSGKIHDKAVLILTNYIGKMFADKAPASFTASLTFEQIYGMIEGDSATCAELYALLSAISGVALRQGIAVTGSMDQNGNVQPVGGVNEKIEGFFDLCNLRGLDGTQGVIVPGRNRKNLLLKEEVVEAVRKGKFSIWAIDRIEDGIEILTGVPAGEASPDGTYSEETFYYMVQTRLDELRRRAKGAEEEKGKEKEPEREEGSCGGCGCGD